MEKVDRRSTKFVITVNVLSKFVNLENNLLVPTLLNEFVSFSLQPLPFLQVQTSHHLISPLVKLVTITGQAAGIQVAVRLLYQRLEQERDKKAAAL